VRDRGRTLSGRESRRVAPVGFLRHARTRPVVGIDLTSGAAERADPKRLELTTCRSNGATLQRVPAAVSPLPGAREGRWLLWCSATVTCLLLRTASAAADDSKSSTGQPPAASTPAGAPVTAPASEPRAKCSDTSEKQHLAGALYEYPQIFGLRYHHTHFYAAGCGEGVFLWAGYGLDLRLLQQNLEQFDAGLAQISGRVGSFPGGGVGFAFEVGAGGGPTRDGARALGFVGALASFYFVDLGAVYFFPLGPFDRPTWIENVRFALRINVPVKKYDERKRHD
jgi:hypothetical protein